MRRLHVLLSATVVLVTGVVGLPATPTAAHRATSSHAAAKALTGTDSASIGRAVLSAAIPADPVTRHDNQVIRWNPCRVITYRINSARASAGAVADVRGAFARLGSASGLSFRYLGATTLIPHLVNGAYSPPAGTDIVVAWANPGVGSGRSNLLHGTTGEGGWGGWVARGSNPTGYRTVWQIRAGYVVLSLPNQRLLHSGFGTGLRRGTLLMHEIGHAVGLQHSRLTSQVMYPTILASARGSYGGGDLAALRLVGRSAGCING